MGVTTKPPSGTPDIKPFLESLSRNKWLHGTKMEVYVRKALHSIDGKITQTLDIANILVHPEFQRQGLFTAWLTYVEKVMKGTRQYEAIYVESILHPGLDASLAKRGYESADVKNCRYKGVKG